MGLLEYGAVLPHRHVVKRNYQSLIIVNQEEERGKRANVYVEVARVCVRRGEVLNKTERPEKAWTKKKKTTESRLPPCVDWVRKLGRGRECEM